MRAHSHVSALSAESVGGTLPEKRFSLRTLRRNVPAHHARVGREDRTGGGAAYREPSLVSAVMLAGIGPVKPFLPKCLIAHSEACGHTEKEPPHVNGPRAAATHSRSKACAASAASPAARKGSQVG